MVSLARRAATSVSRPVPDLDEAPQHAHNRARGTFVEVDGVSQPAPAPRFSRTPAEVKVPRRLLRAAPDDSVLPDWGFAAEDIAALRSANVLR